MNSKYLIVSLQRSLCYLMYCLLQLLISSILLVYVMMDKNNLENSIVIFCELLLTVAICMDILLKTINQGREFFRVAWNIVDVGAFLSIILCISQQYEVYYDEIYGISIISLRYLSLTIRVGIVLKQSYIIQMMQQQRDILIFKRPKYNDLSILDISQGIMNDSQFVETMKLVND